MHLSLEFRYYKYYNTEKHQESVKSELRNEMYKLDYDFVTNFIDEGSVLDIGCGGGFFLDVFDGSRFDKFGVEYGDDGFNVAYEKYPDKVYQGQFTDLDNIENDSFDLIIFRGVLEHVVNPKDHLMKASQVLKNNGWLFISATPNLNSLCADLFRDKFNQHIPAEHIIHFSDIHFKKYLKDIGFRLASERVFYTETPYANIYEDAKLISKAIELREENKNIEFSSPAWYGNMMTLLFQKRHVN